MNHKKIHNSKEYKKNEKMFLSANKDLSDVVKSFLSKKDRWIIDFAFEVTTYSAIFKDAARKHYLKNTTGVLGIRHKNILDYIKSEDLISKEKVENCYREIKDAYLSSIKDENINKKVKEILLDRRLTLTKQSNSISLEEDFIKNALPKYEEEKNLIAQKIAKKYRLKKNGLQQFAPRLHEIVCRLANAAKSSEKKHSTIKFLERFILTYYPRFIRDLKTEIQDSTLIYLRRKSKKPFNSICHLCNKPLNKRTRLLFCTKNENRSCYEQRLKTYNGKLTSKEKKTLSATARTKNTCDNCDRNPSLDFISTISGTSYQFCSQKCKETFRKRMQRK